MLPLPKQATPICTVNNDQDSLQYSVYQGYTDLLNPIRVNIMVPAVHPQRQFRCFDFVTNTFYQYGFSVNEDSWSRVIEDEFILLGNDPALYLPGDLIAFYEKDPVTRQILPTHFARFLNVIPEAIEQSIVIHKPGLYSPFIHSLATVSQGYQSHLCRVFRDILPPAMLPLLIHNLLACKNWIDSLEDQSPFKHHSPYWSTQQQFICKA